MYSTATASFRGGGWTDCTQSYNFSYDAFGNMTELKVGSRSLATYTYGESNGQLLSQSYANGDVVRFTYDHLGRAKTSTYPDGTVVTYTYNGEGSLYSVTAEKDGAETRYIYGYDSLGRLISSEWKDGTASVLRTRQGYDDTNRLVTQSWQLGSDVYTEGFTYNSTQDGSLNTHTTATGQTLTMGYDGLRRLSTITGGIYGKTYTYRDISDTKTTTQVSSVVYDLPTDLTYGYTYDTLGNIATYTDANGTVTYTYDTQGQLLSATNGSTTYSYTYDTVGNILTANGHTYTYGDSVWKDLLTAYDGQPITYDASGNPTSYYNGTRWTFGWTNGRRLATATDGTTNLSYTYDTDGLRTSKTVDGVKHSYLYAGGKLLRETYGNTVLDFFYDNAGSPYALKYNGTTYYYITNLQGDVMSVVDAQGATVASYEYDPYGNVISSSGDMAAINPLRYRGYYYDTEIGMYYLQSRYYDPKVGRFINADSYASTGQGILGNNMFAYCNNNPVNGFDPCGSCSHRLDCSKDCEECENNSEEESTHGTAAVGLTGAVSTGLWAFYVQISIVTDFYGNSEIQFSYGGGVSTGSPGGSVSVNMMFTNAPTVDRLHGTGYQIGGSYSGVGVDYLIIPDTENDTTYTGVSFSSGTPSSDFHVLWGETVPISETSFNLLEFSNAVYRSYWGIYE